jgi:hypothetical protein
VTPGVTVPLGSRETRAWTVIAAGSDTPPWSLSFPVCTSRRLRGTAPRGDEVPAGAPSRAPKSERAPGPRRPRRRLQARASPAWRSFPPPGGPGSPLPTPGAAPAAAPAAAPRAKVPGARPALPSHPDSSPWGTENNGRARPAYQPRSLATEERPWKLCSMIGGDSARLVGRRACGPEALWEM